MEVPETIQGFDEYLADRGLRFEAVVVGGAALALLGVVSRHTKDCDLLQTDLPPAIEAAAKAFAGMRRSSGEQLLDHWFNTGPASLMRDLPEGWRERLREVYSGSALKLRTLGRMDLLRSKLFALCDRAIDLPDCLALAPSPRELARIQPWLCERDGNPMWPDHVSTTLNDLRRRLGHGV